MHLDIDILASAFAIGLGLIMAIGAQNIFIIRTGLQQRNVFLAASIAGLCDTLLIAIGTLFMTALLVNVPGLVGIAQWGGILFLIYYGSAALHNAWRIEPIGWEFDESKSNSGLSVVFSTLAFSLLNPHVYLDTLLILGNMGARFGSDAQKISFIVGAGGASFFWFYLTGFTARRVARIFKKIWVVRSFETVVGVAMFAIAYSLLKMPS